MVELAFPIFVLLEPRQAINQNNRLSRTESQTNRQQRK
jgi:hypothetical protein